MADVEQAIYTALSTTSGVTSLVSTRSYPVVLPQGVAFPAITFSRVSTDPVFALAGSEGKDAVRVQVDCWSRTYANAKDIANAVRAALEASPVYGQMRSQLETFEEETRLFRVMQEYSVWQTN